MSNAMLEPWELMSAAKDVLGVSALGRILGVGHMQIYRQVRNPDFTEDFIRSPIQRIRALVYELKQSGEHELAEGILNYMAEGADMHVTPNSCAMPDKDSIEGECLDDYPVLMELHEAIRSGVDLREIERLAERVKVEVEETVTAVRMEREG
ncbi:hypothetical protein [Halodesulfovibrio sp.]|uniref:hypothetical protein n=1 Tax=Halodesulfovibrio sp. TaxID=1912772 RepID=UPI0025B96D3F|nr:hypothetical protein [Halodesulfovibrio sp.]